MTDTATETVQNPEAVLAELRRAQEDLKALRAEVRTITEQKEALEKAAEGLKDDTWRLRALEAEAKAALQSQGLKDTDRLMPYVGTEGLDFDENGKLTGLNERIEQLKKDLPEVFDAKRRAGGKADIFGTDPAEAKVDPLRQAVHQALSA